MNVKQGDLAIVIKAAFQENIGKIVRVIRYQGQWGRISDAWEVEADGVTGGVNLAGERVPVWPGFPLFASDAYLRPVSGLPVEEYDRLMEKEPA